MRLKPQYLINEQGERISVLLTVDEFRQLLEAVEDQIDTADLDEAMSTDSQVHPYEQIREQLRAEGKL